LCTAENTSHLIHLHNSPVATTRTSLRRHWAVAC
jgi:hypothetical protein